MSRWFSTIQTSIKSVSFIHQPTHKPLHPIHHFPLFFFMLIYLLFFLLFISPVDHLFTNTNFPLFILCIQLPEFPKLPYSCPSQSPLLLLSHRLLTSVPEQGHPRVGVESCVLPWHDSHIQGLATRDSLRQQVLPWHIRRRGRDDRARAGAVTCLGATHLEEQ